MISKYLPIPLLFFSILIFAQNSTIKCEKVYDAVKLIDDGKYDDAIVILRDCEKTDSKDYVYPYEIALAYSYKKEYKNAISQLEKIRNYDNLKDDYYQLFGNAYDDSGDSQKAMEIYDEGLKLFPNSGRLYLERGVVFEKEKKYLEALNSYVNGISVQPTYPSNYFRASKLYLKSNDVLSGIFYGEIFINIERTTDRALEMSKLLFAAYKNSVTFKDGIASKIDLCPSFIDLQKFENDKKHPFCMIYGKLFIANLIPYKEINIETLSKIRSGIMKEYLKEYSKEYPNVLLAYQSTMEENKVLEVYNHYIFQMGATEEFDKWLETHKKEYDLFVDWYTNPENQLKDKLSGLNIPSQLQ